MEPVAQDSPPRKSLWQFRLSSLFALVAIVSILLAWWADHSQQKSQIEALQRDVDRLSGLDLLGYFPQRRPATFETRANAFATLTDGSRIVCANDKLAEVWDMNSGRKLLSLEHSEPVLDLAVSPHGKTLLTITAGAARPARLWDLETGRLLQQYASPFQDGPHRAGAEWPFPFSSYECPNGLGFTSVGFSPDGQRLAAGCEDGTLVVWDVDAAKEVMRTSTKVQRIRNILFSPDGGKLLLVSKDRTLQLWDIEYQALVTQYRERPSARQSGAPIPVAISPDGAAFAFFVAQTQSGKAFGPDTGREVERIRPGWRVEIRDMQTGTEVGGFKFPTIDSSPRDPRQFAFLPDGKTLLTVSGSRLRLWDVESGRMVGCHSLYRRSAVWYAEHLSRIEAVMLVEVENDENTLHNDWTTISIVPFAEFKDHADWP